MTRWKGLHWLLHSPYAARRDRGCQDDWCGAVSKPPLIRDCSIGKPCQLCPIGHSSQRSLGETSGRDLHLLQAICHRDCNFGCQRGQRNWVISMWNFCHHYQGLESIHTLTLLMRVYNRARRSCRRLAFSPAGIGSSHRFGCPTTC